MILFSGFGANMKQSTFSVAEAACGLDLLPLGNTVPTRESRTNRTYKASSNGLSKTGFCLSKAVTKERSRPVCFGELQDRVDWVVYVPNELSCCKYATTVTTTAAVTNNSNNNSRNL